MINVTNEYRKAITNNRKFEYDVRISFLDGTEKRLNQSRLLSLSIKDSVSNTSSFDVGGAIVNQVDAKIDNTDEEYSTYDFDGATITVRIGLTLSNGAVEWLKKGTYTAEPGKYTGAVISVKATDNMTLFDQPYTFSKLTYPATLGAIVRDACSCCGMQLAPDSAAFEMSDYVVDTRPDDKSTFREILSYVGKISCHWCRCNVNGQLSLGWYDQASYEGLQITDAETLAEPAADKTDAGAFSAPAAEVIDAGHFADRKSFHHIFSISSMNISTDDVVITGIRVVEKSSEEENEEDTTYQTGEDGYVLTIEDNKLIQGKGQEVAAYLGRKLIGLRFRPLSVSCLSDPSIEAGDIAYVTDRKGRSYATLITSTTFQAGNYQQIACSAESPTRNSATRYSKYTKVYEELRRKLSRNKTEWQKAIEQLDQRLSTSSGLYSTIETQEDGSNIYYLHDKPTLGESKIVWKMTAEAWGVSTDGGKTWNGGMTVDGEMITKILHTIGLNADWINTGAFVVKDARGNIMFLADTTTGRVVIVADEFMLRGKTIEELSQEANEAILDALAQDIQTQLDGKIETYNQTSDPSTVWTTTTAKQAHTGDLWYSPGTKLTKRWTGTAWVTLDAVDTVAQDLAKSKAQIFTSTPLPPYNVGDLWVQGESGDIMTCITARNSGGYVSADWKKRNKYTDDAYAKEVEDIVAALGEDVYNQLDGKIETYSQATDPSAGWTTAAIKSDHKGDLWYNTSTKLTKRWSGTAWVTLEATDTVAQQLAQSKKRVFVTTPVPPYDVGDLWVGNSASDMKRCQTARSSGTYVSSDWIKAVKYTDDTVANSAFTLAEDAMNASTNPAKYLTQLEVFNKLTNGGTVQGIYLQNGKVYINASYIQTGEFAADRIYGGTLRIGGYANQNGVLEVYNSSGIKVCTIDQNGVDVTQGKIGGFSLSNGILTAVNGYNTFEIHTDGAIKSKYKGGVADQALVIDDGQLMAFSGGENSATYVMIANGNISATRNGIQRFVSDAVSTAVNQTLYLPSAYSSAITSTEYLVFGSGTDPHGFSGKVNRKSSSSRRYKDIGKDVEPAEVLGLYELPVRFFKYKSGYLVDEDERNGVYMPGFIAEELEEILPIAVDHDEHGDPEKWNTDIMIPCMLKMLQEQKKEFDRYKEKTDARITRLEKMLGGGAVGDQ